MADEHDELRQALSGAIGAWHPAHGPDFRHLVHRAHAPWRQPIAKASGVSTAILAVLFALAMLVVMFGPAVPDGAELRSHLVAGL
ncbi:MAG: hypothetical protein M3Y62_01305 [Candidatus Dormibacteraeota bacterium]|nr:hypothetical protein [Candidatus Dormibacteraeota bacterium]